MFTFISVLFRVLVGAVVVLAVCAVGGALAAAIFGVFAAFVALCALVIKLAIIVLVPLFILTWIARWMVGGSRREA